MGSEFGNRLAECLKDFDMTQRELSKKLEVSEVTVSRWVSGERVPNYATVNKIAEVFDISVKFLYLSKEDLCIYYKTKNGSVHTGVLEPHDFKNIDNEERTLSKTFEPIAKIEEEQVDWGAILTNPSFNSTAIIGMVALAKAMGKFSEKDIEQIKDILDR